ncbi:hypothetical protein [Gottfriedia acidiceleris]
MDNKEKVLTKKALGNSSKVTNSKAATIYTVNHPQSINDGEALLIVYP